MRPGGIRYARTMENRTFLAALGKLIASRRTPCGPDGSRLVAGIVILLVATGLFAVIAADVMNGGSITVLDIKLARWLHAGASIGFTRVMLGLSYIHSVSGIFVLTMLLGLYLFRKHAWFWLASLLVVVPCGMLANVLLKYTFGRARPSFTDPILTLATYSFPSGHVAAATLFYGMLAAYLVSRTQDWRLRGALVAAAALMVALVGLSRLYLGVHYFSDVLAALAESCAWLALCLTLCSSLRLYRSCSMTGEKF
jgi:membrane-associated phospholipid phosphatase